MDKVCFGGQSMVGELKDVLLKQHHPIIDLLKHHGVNIHHLFTNSPQDSLLITDAGAVILQSGNAQAVHELQIPILGKIEEPGLVDCKDLVWLDDRILLAGRSYKTNLAGILQLRDVLQRNAIAVMPFDLPHYVGRESPVHLHSLISMVDVDLAVVYSALMPASLVDYLQKRKIQFIEASESDFRNFGTQIFAIKPRVVLMREGFSELKKRLEEHHIQVLTHKGEDLSFGKTLRREKVRDKYGDGDFYG